MNPPAGKSMGDARLLFFRGPRGGVDRGAADAPSNTQTFGTAKSSAAAAAAAADWSPTRIMERQRHAALKGSFDIACIQQYVRLGEFLSAKRGVWSGAGSRGTRSRDYLGNWEVFRSSDIEKTLGLLLSSWVNCMAVKCICLRSASHYIRIPNFLSTDAAMYKMLKYLCFSSNKVVFFGNYFCWVSSFICPSSNWVT